MQGVETAGAAAMAVFMSRRAGWRLSLGCVCEGIVEGIVVFHFGSQLDLTPIIEYAMT